MRKIILLIGLSFFLNDIDSANSINQEKEFFQLKSDSIFFSEIDKLSMDLYQIVESFHESEIQVISLFQVISKLANHVLNVNPQSFSDLANKITIEKEIEEIYLIFSQLICDFLSILDLNKIEISSLSKELHLENLLQLQQSKTRETKMVFLKNLIDKKDLGKINGLINEFSLIFSTYLNNELKVFVNDAYGKLCIYLGCSENVDDPLIFRRGGKKRRFFAAIFGAIGKACLSIVSLISGKDNKNQKENVLNLCGTAFNLISELSSMKNSEDEKKGLTKIEQESVLNLAAQTIEDLYAVLKKTNIELDGESKKFLMDNLASFTSSSERRTWIEKSLKDRGLSEKLLMAVFKCLKKCFQEVVEKVVEILSEKMMDIMVAYVHSKT